MHIAIYFPIAGWSAESYSRWEQVISNIIILKLVDANKC